MTEKTQYLCCALDQKAGVCVYVCVCTFLKKYLRFLRELLWKDWVTRVTV